MTIEGFEQKSIREQMEAETDPVKKAELQKRYEMFKPSSKNTLTNYHKKLANWLGIKGIFWKLKSYMLIAVTVLLLIVFYIMRKGAVVT